MHCSSCGANLPPVADFCPYCGTQIGGPEAGPADTAEAGPQPWGSAAAEDPPPGAGEPPPQDASLGPEREPRGWFGRSKKKKVQPRLSIQEPPKPEMPLWQKVPIYVGSFAIVAILALWGLHLYQSADAARAVGRHLETLQKQRWANAYSQTSTSFQQATSERDFTLLVRSEQALGLLAYYSVDGRTIDGDRATIQVTLTDRSGIDTPAAFDLVKENNAWRIAAIRLDEEADSTPAVIPVSSPTTTTSPTEQTDPAKENDPDKSPADDRSDSGKVDTR